MKNSNLIIGIVVIALVVLGGRFLLSNNNKDVEKQLPTTPKPTIANEEKIMQEKQNIIEIASSNEAFSTLVSAVKAAGLVETLSGKGPFTVFAPTNEAFAKIPKETLDAILKDKDQLTAILTYHVVAGKVEAKDVVNLTSAKTVEGTSLNIKVTGNNVMVNNATVTKTDIQASNGVIHVIDTVLIPN